MSFAAVRLSANSDVAVTFEGERIVAVSGLATPLLRLNLTTPVTTAKQPAARRGVI